MKTGRSLTDWASEIERQTNAKRDIVADSREITITDPHDRAEDYTEVAAEQGGVLRHLASGGDLTHYGLINAVTAFSQDVVDYDRATELETMGGKLVELSPDQWREVAQAA